MPLFVEGRKIACIGLVLYYGAHILLSKIKDASIGFQLCLNLESSNHMILVSYSFALGDLKLLLI